MCLVRKLLAGEGAATTGSSPAWTMELTVQSLLGTREIGVLSRRIEQEK